ncbi:MAG: DUF374 domain-containing protein [Planctomycetota bacterium]|nr:DUF374 domain-containing protein [Planctomycetota bacterium]
MTIPPLLPHPVLMKATSADPPYPLAGRALSVLLPALYDSLDLRWSGGHHAIDALRKHGNLVVGFWHEWVLPLSYTLRSNGFAAITSQHLDGARLGSALYFLDVALALGSSSRGGLRGFQELEKLVHEGHSPVLAVDGPKGPPRQAKEGAAALARRTGIPMIPLGFAVDRSLRLSTWDRMILPAPWGKAVIVVGPPVYPAKERKGDSDAALRFQNALDEATDQARDNFDPRWREGSGTSPLGTSGLTLAAQ